MRVDRTASKHVNDSFFVQVAFRPVCSSGNEVAGVRRIFSSVYHLSLSRFYFYLMSLMFEAILSFTR